MDPFMEDLQKIIQNIVEHMPMELIIGHTDAITRSSFKTAIVNNGQDLSSYGTIYGAYIVSNQSATHLSYILTKQIDQFNVLMVNTSGSGTSPSIYKTSDTVRIAIIYQD